MAPLRPCLRSMTSPLFSLFSSDFEEVLLLDLFFFFSFLGSLISLGLTEVSISLVIAVAEMVSSS